MWQPIFMISGYFVSILGLSMLIPAAVDMYYTKQDWSPFITSAIISLFIGVSLFLGNRTKIEKISIRQGYLITAISWFALSLLSALLLSPPAFLSACVFSLPDRQGIWHFRFRSRVPSSHRDL